MVENTGLDAIVNDNCEIANLINDYTNTESLYDASFEIGTTTVTWTATDIAGNENTCSFDITVNAWVGIETLKRNDIMIKGIIFNNKDNDTDEILLRDNIETIEKLSGIKVLKNMGYDGGKCEF